MNDPRLQMLQKRDASDELALLRRNALQLLESGYPSEAMRLLELLLTLGDAQPVVLFMASVAAGATNRPDAAVRLLDLCAREMSEYDPVLGRAIEAWRAKLAGTIGTMTS